MHEECCECADDADRGRDAQDAKPEREVDEPPPVIADEPRQEAEGLRDQRRRDGRHRRVQRVFGPQQREYQDEDRRKQRRAADAAQHRARGDENRHREHEPVQRKIHSARLCP